MIDITQGTMPVEEKRDGGQGSAFRERELKARLKDEEELTATKEERCCAGRQGGY